MSEITDEYMHDMLAKSATYTAVLLKAGPNYGSPDTPAIVWEHGRRNFSLRAEGALAIVCPIADDSPWAGIGIFNADEEATRRIMDDDPGVKAGVFTCEMHSVRSFPGDRLP